MTPDILISILFILSTILVTALGFLIKAFRDQRSAIQAAKDIKVASISGEMDSNSLTPNNVKPALIHATPEQGTSPTMVQPKIQGGELGRAPNQGLLAEIHGFSHKSLKVSEQNEHPSFIPTPEQAQILNRRSTIADDTTDTTECISSQRLTKDAIQAHNIATAEEQPAPSSPQQPSLPVNKYIDLSVLESIIPHIPQGDAQSESGRSDWSTGSSTID